MALQAVILTIAAVALATTAGAQDRSAQDSAAAVAPPRIASETTGAGGVPLAPVGHRQPTVIGLPDSVRKDENGNGPAPVDPLGPLPKICNGC